MTSEQLAESTQSFCNDCNAPKGLTKLVLSRILGVGRKQYSSGDRQAFEDYTPEKLMEMFREEVADTMVYLKMLILQQPDNTQLIFALRIFGRDLMRAYSFLDKIR